MRLSKQKGVALIQVLLISVMLILLVVQFSKESQYQVETAILLKQKANTLASIYGAMEKSKFLLLTKTKDVKVPWQKGGDIGFYGEDVTVRERGNDLLVSFQDEAGLLSVPYSEGLLQRYLKVDGNLLESIKQWNGTNASGTIPPSYRGGLMPDIRELQFVPQLKNRELDLAYLTHLPTEYFCIASAPKKLLERVLGEQAQQFIGLRESNKLNSQTIKPLLRGNAEISDILIPSDITRVTVKGAIGDWHVSRSKKFLVNPASDTPLIELEM